MSAHYQQISDDLYGTKPQAGGYPMPQGPPPMPPQPPPPPNQAYAAQPMPPPPPPRPQQPSELQYLRHVVSQLAGKIQAMEKGGDSNGSGNNNTPINWQLVLLGASVFLLFILVLMGAKLLKRSSMMPMAGTLQSTYI